MHKSQEIEIDARGMRCPWPALRLARAVRQAGGQGRFILIADDPVAERDIPALAAENGWAIEQLASDAPLLTWLISAKVPLK